MLWAVPGFIGPPPIRSFPAEKYYQYVLYFYSSTIEWPQLGSENEGHATAEEVHYFVF